MVLVQLAFFTSTVLPTGGSLPFVFLPYTQTHMPVVPSAEFKGKSGNGDWGDVLLQIDAYTGRLLDTIKELGVADNTIFIFTADNGPEMLPGHNGWGGPWRGSYRGKTFYGGQSRGIQPGQLRGQLLNHYSKTISLLLFLDAL